MAAIPELSDGSVVLRAPTVDDAAAMVQLCTDPDMLRFTTVPRDYTLGMAEQRIEHIVRAWSDPSGVRTWVIAREGEHGFAGLIDLRPAAFPSAASLGFSLHPDARGQGLMARAVRLVAEFAFTRRPWGAAVQRLHWTALVDNWASRRVAWATGFAMHGTLPGSHVHPEDATAPPLDSWQGSLAVGDPKRPRTPWFIPPEATESDLRLRAWREADIQAIEPRHDPAHWMPGPAMLRRDTFPDWLSKRRARMADGTAVVWCVAHADRDRALGAVLIFNRSGPITGDSAELGYEVFPSARGRGVASRGAAMAIAYARMPTAQGGLGLRRLTAETAADNEASNRVLRRLGFAMYGREHAVSRFADGSYGDNLHWELRLQIDEQS